MSPDAAHEVAPAKGVKGAAFGTGRLRRIIADKLLSARKSKVWLLVHADTRVLAGLAQSPADAEALHAAPRSAGPRGAYAVGDGARDARARVAAPVARRAARAARGARRLRRAGNSDAEPSVPARHFCRLLRAGLGGVLASAPCARGVSAGGPRVQGLLQGSAGQRPAAAGGGAAGAADAEEARVLAQAPPAAASPRPKPAARPGPESQAPARRVCRRLARCWRRRRR